MSFVGVRRIEGSLPAPHSGAYLVHPQMVPVAQGPHTCPRCKAPANPPRLFEEIPRMHCAVSAGCSEMAVTPGGMSSASKIRFS